MIPLEDFKRRLPKECPLSEEEIRKLRDLMVTLAQVAVDQFLELPAEEKARWTRER